MPQCLWHQGTGEGEVQVTYKGKDGWRRNAVKLKEEFKHMSKFMGEDWKRWFKAPWDMHAYVNLFVESRRLSPYFTGHVDAVLYPVLLGIIWILA